MLTQQLKQRKRLFNRIKRKYGGWIVEKGSRLHEQFKAYPGIEHRFPTKEDLIQGIYVKVFENYETRYDKTLSKPTTWIGKLAHSMVVDIIKTESAQKRKRVEIPIDAILQDNSNGSKDSQDRDFINSLFFYKNSHNQGTLTENDLPKSNCVDNQHTRLELAEVRRLVRESLRQLPKKYRIILIGYYFRYLTDAQIARKYSYIRNYSFNTKIMFLCGYWYLVKKKENRFLLVRNSQRKTKEEIKEFAEDYFFTLRKQLTRQLRSKGLKLLKRKIIKNNKGAL